MTNQRIRLIPETRLLEGVRVIDTGMYDNPEVQKAVCEISDEYGGLHRQRFALASPISVGYVALAAFTSPAHITSINLVAQGQFPNEGS